MKKTPIKIKYSFISAAIALAIAGPVQAYQSPIHTFSKKDVMGSFDGTTWNNVAPYKTDLPLSSTIFCGMPKSVFTCEEVGAQTIIDKDLTELFPIDSEFGFYVADFLGAQQKAVDALYEEGYAGNIFRDGQRVGIRISNSSTESYKVPSGMGSWCAGLGGTKVKCDSERYTVMEHILSCFETIPYSYADSVLGTQGIRELPDGRTFDCANAQLDDVVNLVVDGEVTEVQLTDVTVGAQMDANDLTDVQNNYAKSTDYSISLKDDGKPLYLWGNTVKRPNDVRMYAKIPLPADWKGQEAATVAVTSAKLVVKHVVTNNPNDQIRPEDLENEAAIGRLPSYKVTGSGETEVWTSLKDCYEGDGDLIDATEGGTDPTQIPTGTVLRNMPFALDGINDPVGSPLPFSADQVNGMTNGWYTTVDREPFEWSYRHVTDDVNTFEFLSSPVPLPGFRLPDGTVLGMFEDGTYGTLESGPRWRLKPNKFGQDLPGLEIPLNECTPPPYANDNIKYEVGAPVTTVINLLDWDTVNEGPSPLATSKGWVDVNTLVDRDLVTIVGSTGEDGTGYPLTSNGLPMTEDFDLAIYVKGDKKPTSVYTAQLFINEEPTAADLEPYVDPLAGGTGDHTQ